MENYDIVSALSDLNAAVCNLRASLDDRTATHHKFTDLKDLYTALAQAQAEMDIAKLDAGNPHFKSRYASIASLVRASRPALSKYGLAVYQKYVNADGGKNLITLITHSSGQYDVSELFIPFDANPQKFGSYASYMKRYAYREITGVIAEDQEDDDGEYVRKQVEQEEPSITAGQVKILQEGIDLLDNSDEIQRKILGFNKVKSLSELKQSQFKRVYEYILKEAGE